MGEGGGKITRNRACRAAQARVTDRRPQAACRPESRTADLEPYLCAVIRTASVRAGVRPEMLAVAAFARTRAKRGMNTRFARTHARCGDFQESLPRLRADSTTPHLDYGSIRPSRMAKRARCTRS